MQFLRDAARDGATRLTERIKAATKGDGENALSAVSALGTASSPSERAKEGARARAVSGGAAARADEEAEVTRKAREEKLQELEEEYMEEVRRNPTSQFLVASHHRHPGPPPWSQTWTRPVCVFVCVCEVNVPGNYASQRKENCVPQLSPARN